MPELPEVQTVANELNKKLKDKTIKKVNIFAPKIVAIGPQTLAPTRKTPVKIAQQFKKLLFGQKFLSVSRRAKLLIFDLSGPLSILVHLKMTGQFIYEDKRLRQKTGGRYRLINKTSVQPELLPSKHTHVIFTFTDNSHLYFNDVRKFGYLKIVRDNEINRVPELQQYGPEPLSKKFTFPNFYTIVKKLGKRKINVKQFLTDQKIIAGIGNIYSDEILYHAKVRPTRVVASLSNKDIAKIYKWIRPVLEKGIEAKGSSVGDFVRTDGSWGQMGKFHYVYGRAGEKCKRCGTIISSVKLNGRTASFCPKEQK